MLSLFSKGYRKIKHRIWIFNHNRRNIESRKRLNERAKTASIISMNCTGGILSHDLGLQFRSPTVNMFMRAEDFIKFCENLKYYLSIDHFVACTDKSVIEDRTYPIAYLDDLTLFLVHYSTLEQAEEKWNERKKRINWNNIVIINTDREGMTDALKDRFEKLPFRKVMFTHLPDAKHPSSFYLRGYENDPCVGIITDPEGWRGARPVDQYDYVKLLNED